MLYVGTYIIQFIPIQNIHNSFFYYLKSRYILHNTAHLFKYLYFIFYVYLYHAIKYLTFST